MKMEQKCRSWFGAAATLVSLLAVNASFAADANSASTIAATGRV
jgi:hypothetical protein